MSLSAAFSKKLGHFQLDVNLHANAGIMGILGASGCGKSLTLKCLAGIEKPDTGKIVLDGVTLFDSEKGINLPPQKRKTGYLFQNYALFPNMNVAQNILCGLHFEKNKMTKKSALNDIINIMQLNGLEAHKPHELSGGQQQRVALARILVGEPNLLMLDEPFSALDAHLRGFLQLQMHELLKKFNKTVLMVTHDRNEAYRLCDNIALISNGKIIIIKNTKELFAHPQSRQAAIMTGCKNIIDAKKTGDYEITVPDWGVSFKTAHPPDDKLCAVGIRAHYFNAKTSHNRYPVRFVSQMEEPFEFIYQFRYQNQNQFSPDIWWRLPKDKKETQPNELGVAPQNVLPLCE